MDYSFIPIVSICCITYNHQHFIRESLEGLLMQKTNFLFEILIYDDASNDNTAKIIKEYELKYPDKIKPVYQTENQYSKGVRGINSKYNFPRAKGKYIALCEGDDYWTDPLKLQKQIDFLEANPDYILSCHHCHYLKENEVAVQDVSDDYSFSSFTLDDIIKGNFITTCSVVFRNPGKLPSYSSKLPIGDWPLYLHLAKKGKIHFINKFMGVYRIHSGGIFSGQEKIVKIKQLLETTELIISNKEFEEKRLIRKIKTTRANYILQILSLIQFKNEKFIIKLKWYNRAIFNINYFTFKQIRYLVLFPLVTLLKRNDSHGA
ncbi:MAG: glycosyltransferase [Bacteroidota bacterium]